MAVAFLAGLLTAGAAILMPGGERPTDGWTQPQKDSSEASPAPAEEDPKAPVPPGPPPQAIPQPRIAIVVDDCGYDPPRDAEWLKFPEKITMAVIPFGPSSRRIAQSAHERGFGVLIHVPMEPEGNVSDATDGFRFRRGMDGKEMRALLGKMIAENPWASGVSNHMGSAFTADPKSMAVFAALLKSKGLFFLDSVTTPRSTAVRTALQAGIPVARRDVLLDGEMQPEEMRTQWNRMLSIAREKGKAVLLCQGKRESLRTILDLVVDLESEGIRAVTLDELLARDSPS